MSASFVKTRHLRTFVEAARQGSIGRAAMLLNVSQPAVTKTIRELESLLGKQLFAKDGRGVKITPYGEVFLRHAGTALAAIQQGIDSLGSLEAGPPITIGALPTVSAHIMPRVMKLFLAENTDSRVKIVTGENTVLLDQLRGGILDLVIGRLAAPEQMSGLSFEYLYSEQVRFVVRKGHPMLVGGSFDFARLPQYPVLMPSTGSVIRPFVDRYLLAHGMAELPYAIETVSDSFGRAFVEDTDAVWIISDGVIRRDAEADRLAILPLDTTETRGAVGLTMREGAAPHAALDILCAMARSVTQRFST